MHGELLKARCGWCGRREDCRGDLSVETICEGCWQAGAMRPDVVWFGEMPDRPRPHRRRPRGVRPLRRDRHLGRGLPGGRLRRRGPGARHPDRRAQPRALGQRPRLRRAAATVRRPRRCRPSSRGCWRSRADARGVAPLLAGLAGRRGPLRPARRADDGQPRAASPARARASPPSSPTARSRPSTPARSAGCELRLAGRRGRWLLRLGDTGAHVGLGAFRAPLRRPRRMEHSRTAASSLTIPTTVWSSSVRTAASRPKAARSTPPAGPSRARGTVRTN